jgi:hypothetical protein
MPTDSCGTFVDQLEANWADQLGDVELLLGLKEALRLGTQVQIVFALLKQELVALIGLSQVEFMVDSFLSVDA